MEREPTEEEKIMFAEMKARGCLLPDYPPENDGEQRWSRYPRQDRAGLKWWVAPVHTASFALGSEPQ